MKKILENSEYIFDASARTITFSFQFELQNILLITNLASATIIYRFDKVALGAQSFISNVLTLDFDTSSMSDSDILQIIIDIEGSGEEVDLLGEINTNTALLEQTNIILESLNLQSSQSVIEDTLLGISAMTENVEDDLSEINTKVTGLNLESTQLQIKNELEEINTNTTGLTLESTQVEIKALSAQVNDMCLSINNLIQFLYANSPRVDVANRMAVNSSEVTQPISGTVTASVANATVSNIVTISTQPQQFVGQDVPLHIYDNIKITP